MARLEVIAGPMFSGKSTEFIRRLRRFIYAHQNVLIIKPVLDARTSVEIAARRKKDAGEKKFAKQETLPAYVVGSAEEILKLIDERKPTILGVDEVQFFDEWFIETVAGLLEKYADSDFTIIAAGLDMDYQKKPFGIMPTLMAMADDVKKETAVCFKCHGQNANLTYKIGGSDSQIEIGDSELYEARCRKCHK